jgi:TPR repeat protein
MANKYLGMAKQAGNERALVIDCWQFIIPDKQYTDPFARGYLARFSGVFDLEEEEFVNFQMSAHQGDEYGQYYLGLCYLEGTGTTTNIDEGIQWLTKSAEQGYYDAQREIGIRCQWNGDIELSKKWYKKAYAQEKE